MSFWTTTEGNSVETNGEFEENNDFQHFPNNTELLGYFDEASWNEAKPEHGGGRYISLRFTAVAPECYKNRKVFDKLWVDKADSGKQGERRINTDISLLAAMATQAGGELLKLDTISDDDLARELLQKQMVIKLKYYSFKNDIGEEIQGNRIKGIGSASKGVSETPPKAAPKPSGGAGSGGTGSGSRDFDDSIPF